MTREPANPVLLPTAPQRERTGSAGAWWATEWVDLLTLWQKLRPENRPVAMRMIQRLVEMQRNARHAARSRGAAL